MPRIRRLRRAELPQRTVPLARFLIGKTLVRERPGGRITGRIVETEAYIQGDAACHAFRGQTPRNQSLFLERGHAYVYFIYGTYFMLNVSGASAGRGEGVLLRALEPLEGVALMEDLRGTRDPRALARGPGRLAQALDIDKSLDGLDLCAAGPLWLATASRPAGKIGVSTRIGLTVDAERALRFYERGNPFVSGTKKLNA